MLERNFYADIKREGIKAPSPVKGKTDNKLVSVKSPAAKAKLPAHSKPFSSSSPSSLEKTRKDAKKEVVIRAEARVRAQKGDEDAIHSDCAHTKEAECI